MNQTFGISFQIWALIITTGCFFYLQEKAFIKSRCLDTQLDLNIGPSLKPKLKNATIDIKIDDIMKRSAISVINTDATRNTAETDC